MPMSRNLGFGCARALRELPDLTFCHHGFRSQTQKATVCGSTCSTRVLKMQKCTCETNVQKCDRDAVSTGKVANCEQEDIRDRNTVSPGQIANCEPEERSSQRDSQISYANCEPERNAVSPGQVADCEPEERSSQRDSRISYTSSSQRDSRISYTSSPWGVGGIVVDGATRPQWTVRWRAALAYHCRARVPHRRSQRWR